MATSHVAETLWRPILFARTLCACVCVCGQAMVRFEYLIMYIERVRACVRAHRRRCTTAPPPPPGDRTATACTRIARFGSKSRTRAGPEPSSGLWRTWRTDSISARSLARSLELRTKSYRSGVSRHPSCLCALHSAAHKSIHSGANTHTHTWWRRCSVARANIDTFTGALDPQSRTYPAQRDAVKRSLTRHDRNRPREARLVVGVGVSRNLNDSATQTHAHVHTI